MAGNYFAYVLVGVAVALFCQSVEAGVYVTPEQQVSPTQTYSLRSTLGPGSSLGPSLRFSNQDKDDIIVWLDPDMPPCLPVEEGGPAIGKCGFDGWTNAQAKFSVEHADGGTIRLPAASHQQIKAGETWVIELPRGQKDGKVHWCFDRDGSRQCPGTGAWVTRAGISMPNPGHVMRMEYNWNSDNIWYNLSGVDGINAQISLQYSGGDDSCDRTLTECVIDFGDCPWSTKDASGATVCESAKFHAVSCPGFGGHTGDELAGCPYADDATKCLCHRWWQTTTCGERWTTFLQKNKSGRCDMYAWAYDEKVLKDPSGCEEVDNSVVSPLRVCPLNQTSGDLNAKIMKVM